MVGCCGAGAGPVGYDSAPSVVGCCGVGAGPAAAALPGSGASGYMGAERAGWSSSAVWNPMRNARTPGTDSTPRRAEHRLNCQESNDCRWVIAWFGLPAPGSGVCALCGVGLRCSGSGVCAGSGDCPLSGVGIPPRWSAPGRRTPYRVRERGLGPIGSAPGAGPRTVPGGELPSTGCGGPAGGSSSRAEPCWRLWSDPLARRALCDGPGTAPDGSRSRHSRRRGRSEP